MDTPTNYDNVCQKALDAQKKYNLTDTQTLLYNHICRGDFYLRNEDGEKFYHHHNNGFGWSGDRKWVKKQMQPLVKAGLVKHESLHNCRDPRYTSWVWYDADYDYNELINASCYVTTSKIFMIKHYLNLPDGFKKKNVTYGDFEFIYNNNIWSLRYKGQEDNISFDHNGEGKIRSHYDFSRTYSSFSEMTHQIWSYLAHEGKEYTDKIPGTTTKRYFSPQELIDRKEAIDKRRREREEAERKRLEEEKEAKRLQDILDEKRKITYTFEYIKADKESGIEVNDFVIIPSNGKEFVGYIVQTDCSSPAVIKASCRVSVGKWNIGYGSCKEGFFIAEIKVNGKKITVEEFKELQEVLNFNNLYIGELNYVPSLTEEEIYNKMTEVSTFNNREIEYLEERGFQILKREEWDKNGFSHKHMASVAAIPGVNSHYLFKSATKNWDDLEFQPYFSTVQFSSPWNKESDAYKRHWENTCRWCSSQGGYSLAYGKTVEEFIDNKFFIEHAPKIMPVEFKFNKIYLNHDYTQEGYKNETIDIISGGYEKLAAKDFSMIIELKANKRPKKVDEYLRGTKGWRGRINHCTRSKYMDVDYEAIEEDVKHYLGIKKRGNPGKDDFCMVLARAGDRVLVGYGHRYSGSRRSLDSRNIESMLKGKKIKGSFYLKTHGKNHFLEPLKKI
jgi:hypothetical protein